MKKVVILGAGFSGMTAAYYLCKAGFEVEVFEKQSGPGGLIKTINTPWGKCEAAANGILNSTLFEELAQDVGLKLVPTQKLSGKRFIFRERPRRWPLSFFETLTLIFKFLKSGVTGRKPKENETVGDWGRRILGRSGTKYLLAPALQGIYAGDISQMSAPLIFGRFFKRPKQRKPKLRGLVSFEGGMSEFFEKTESFLKLKGVKFKYEVVADTKTISENAICVVATSAPAAGEVLGSSNSKVGQILKSTEMLSLVKMTAFYHESEDKLKGFGILFPRDQKFKALGVLLNDFIFRRKLSKYKSESFIFGGALDEEAVKYPEPEILRLACADRGRFHSEKAPMIGHHVQKWPATLPHYTIALEKNLKVIAPEVEDLEKRGIYIIGNFLGGIGLSQLLERASALPQRILNQHG